MQLAVVIVTWNVREIVLDALRSLYADLATAELQTVVYVVDSASSDGTADVVAQAFPQTRLIASKENLGFGRANNVAIREIMASESPPNAVYLLNPDTITHTGATRTLYDSLMAHPRWGLVGAQLAYEDGSFQHGAFAFPGLRQLYAEFFPTPGRLIEGRFNGRYPRSMYESGQPFAVDFTLGATMMLRRDVIAQTGMFDEAFFMYCEEIDWAWRIHKAGWGVYCVPTSHVTHLAGKSTSQVRPQSVINLWTSRLRLYDKHHPRWKAAFARRLIAAGMNRKLAQLAHQPLNDESRTALATAYQTVRQLASGHQS